MILSVKIYCSVTRSLMLKGGKLAEMSRNKKLVEKFVPERGKNGKWRKLYNEEFFYFILTT